MKIRIILLSFITTFIICSIYSCNEENTNCVECNENYQNVSVEFMKKTFEFSRKVNVDKKYVSLIYKMRYNEIQSFYNLIYSKHKIRIDNVITTTIFTTKNEINSKHDYKINFNDIIGFIAYVKDDLNTLKLKIYKFEENKLVEGKLINTLTDRISINDQFKIGLIEFNSKSNTILTFSIDKELPKNKSIRVTLKDSIDKYIEKSSYYNKVMQGGEDTCQDCGDAKTYGECDYDKTCNEAPCTSEEAERKLKAVGNNNYDYVNIKEDLHRFRDVYLKNKQGGDKIIKTYYKLSQKLPIENLSITQCVKTFDLIVSDVIPLTKKILDNPESNEILIDNVTNQKIIFFLNEVKVVFPDNDSKNKIENIINKVNHFSNKSNKYITENLNNF